jgi:protein-serine/threonine kinase
LINFYLGYKINDYPCNVRSQDYAGRYVYPHDAEDIKAHKWFKDIQWDRIHLTVPPFVPEIKSLEDTQYFDEEEPISDFSESTSGPPATAQEISEALKPFNREVQILTRGFIASPYDSIKLRKVEQEIDGFAMGDEQKGYLKAFIKHYGRKEMKRPRDKLLRDKDTAPKVLELRKKSAFLGYTYRKFCPSKETLGQSIYHRRVLVESSQSKKNVWHRARLSIE